MRTGISRPLIFVVISVLVVALMYSSLSTFYTSTFYVFAAPQDPCFEQTGTIGCPERTCKNIPSRLIAQCCWNEFGATGYVCQECEVNTETGDFENCSEVWGSGASEQPPTPPPGPGGPLGSIPEGGGLLPELRQSPPSPSPEEIAPTIDCAQNPDDPLCETATIPEGENESQTQGRIIGESPSPTGYCAPIRTPTCIPCDPGLPGSTCVPESDWPPTRTTDTGTPEEAAPLVPPATGPLGETAPQIAPPTAEDGTGQPPTEILCIEGFELDEDTNLCVPTESQVTEEPQEAAEPEEQQQTEEQPSEESGSEGDNSNN